jgi:hypothetical protein
LAHLLTASLSSVGFKLRPRCDTTLFGFIYEILIWNMIPNRTVMVIVDVVKRSDGLLGQVGQFFQHLVKVVPNHQLGL